jgi:hypothetical protein
MPVCDKTQAHTVLCSRLEEPLADAISFTGLARPRTHLLACLLNLSCHHKLIQDQVHLQIPYVRLVEALIRGLQSPQISPSKVRRCQANPPHLVEVEH